MSDLKKFRSEQSWMCLGQEFQRERGQLWRKKFCHPRVWKLVKHISWVCHTFPPECQGIPQGLLRKSGLTVEIHNIQQVFLPYVASPA